MDIHVLKDQMEAISKEITKQGRSDQSRLLAIAKTNIETAILYLKEAAEK